MKIKKGPRTTKNATPQEAHLMAGSQQVRIPDIADSNRIEKENDQMKQRAGRDLNAPCAFKT